MEEIQIKNLPKILQKSPMYEDYSRKETFPIPKNVFNIIKKNPDLIFNIGNYEDLLKIYDYFMIDTPEDIRNWEIQNIDEALSIIYPNYTKNFTKKELIF